MGMYKPTREKFWMAGLSSLGGLSLTAVMGLVLTGIFGATHLKAQSIFGTITGTITDTSGGILRNATVTATLVATSQQFTAKTNELGIYNVPNLKDGTYRMEVQAPGFKKAVLPEVVLTPRQQLREDVSLELGDVKQETVVSADPGLINTDSANLTDILTTHDLDSGPLLVTYASLYNSFAVTSIYGPATEGTNPSFAGSRLGQYNVTFDGANTMGGGDQSVGVNLMNNVLWMQEAKAEYVNNSAEFGQLAQIDVVVKSGTNDLHGQVFDYYEDDGLTAARDFFASGSPRGIIQFYGFDVGGPVYLPKVYNGKQHKTYFYLSYEHQHYATLANFDASVPTAAMRAGDFSSLGVPIKNPFTGAVYSNGIIPQSAINPVSKALQNTFWPLPNYGDPNVYANENYRSTVLGPPSTVRQPVGRIDQAFGDKNYLFGSFIYASEKFIIPPSLPVTGYTDYARPEKVYNIAYSHIFTPALVNEFRFGGGSDIVKFQPPWGSGTQYDQSLGISGLAPGIPSTIPGYPQVSFTSIGITPIQTVYNLYRVVLASQHWSDTVSYFRGRHSMKFGGEIGRYWEYILSASPNLFGSATFAPQYSAVGSANPNPYLAYADFLFGAPSKVARAYAPAAQEPTRNTQAFFVTDTWKATSKLTVNMGLRYELASPWGTANGAMSEFDPARAAIVVPQSGLSLVSPLMPTGYVPVITTSAAGLPSNFIRTDKHEFGPRIGLAFRPFGDKTVFRAGYGIFYNVTPAEPTYADVPFTIAQPAYTNTANTPTVAFPQIFPASGTSGPSTVNLPTFLNPNLTMPYSQQWNATIEREQGGFALRASVVGTYTRHMIYSTNLNSPAVDSNLFINKPRPFQLYPAIGELLNGANHNYNGLNLALTRRMKGGLQWETQFTWAKDMGDDVSPEDPFSLSRERAPDAGTPKFRFTNNVVYELPLGRGKALLRNAPLPVDKVFGGWQLTVMYFAGSGDYYTPTVTIPDPTGTFYTDSATRAIVTIRPDQLTSSSLSNPSIYNWFKTAAYANPPIGRFGNSARSTVVGPGMNFWNAAVEKWVTFSDNARVPRLRLDMYSDNIFNHPNFGPPGLNISDPSSAGIITYTGGPGNNSFGGLPNVARLVNFSARIVW